MPIEGRTLGEVSQSFKEHLNRLLSHTITPTPLVAFIAPRTGLAVPPLDKSYDADGIPSWHTRLNESYELSKTQFATADEI